MLEKNGIKNRKTGNYNILKKHITYRKKKKTKFQELQQKGQKRNLQIKIERESCVEREREKLMWSLKERANGETFKAKSFGKKFRN